MGNLNCSCFSSNEASNQITFPPDQKNPVLNTLPKKNMSGVQEEDLFDIICSHYLSENIEVQKITDEEFSEKLNSIPNSKKILDEFEEKLENPIYLGSNPGPLKFINKSEEILEKNILAFYYDGEFNNEGIISGKGTKVVENYLIYKGEFTNDIYNGKGLLIKLGAYIFGDWEKGKCGGKVIYKVEDEFEYEGEFEKNKKNGQGVEKYSDGSVYEGNFINNIKSGKGIYRFPNDEIYDGNFENNLYNGEGTYLWGPGGKKYQGEFKDGIINGKGILTYEDGTIYNGSFEKGLKNGEGCIEFPDGKKYYGNWVNNELYGNGYLVNGNEKTEVVFRHGKVISAITNEEIKGNNINNYTEEIVTNRENVTDSLVEENNNKINNNEKSACYLCKSEVGQPSKCSKCNNIVCDKCRNGQICANCNKDFNLQ